MTFERPSTLASIDVRSLAAFRIMLGVMLFWDQFHALRDARIFFSDDGAMSRVLLLTQYHPEPSHWCLHLLGGSVPVISVLMLMGMAAAVAVTLGWRTRWSVLVAWLLTISLQNRNPVVLYGGDVVLRMMCFWSLFLPLGACWSLDAARSPTRSANPYRSLGTMAALMQVAIIYWFTAMLKNGNDWTRDGTAVYNVLMSDQFVRTAGLWLLPHEAWCRWLTFGVWWLEFGGPFLLLIPWRSAWWRMAVVGAMWMMHLGLLIFIRVGPFPVLMMSLWLLFVPGVVWDWLARRWPLLATEFAPPSPLRWSWRRIVTEAFCLICLGIVVLWNLWTVNPQRWWLGPVPGLNTLAQVLRLDQSWNMFAPTSTTDDGWMLLDAELYDGTHIDLLRNGQPLDFAKPRRISSEFPDWKWHKFQFNLAGKNNEALRTTFGDSLAREWSQNHPRVRRWTLWFVREDTLPHYRVGAPQKIELAQNPMFICR